MARAAARFFITADSSGVTKGTHEAERALSRLNSAGTRSFGALKIGALAAGAAVGGTFVMAMRTGIAEMMEAEKVSAQTAAAIKSTGGAANVARKDIEGLASALEAKTGMDGQAIQSGQNLLLTFTNLRNEAGKGNDIFNQTTRTMVDMSVALGQDAKSSAMQLGKALNDPVKGVTALQRVGVSFTQGQRDQIKAMVEAGNTMGAQRVILAELNKEFGKSGEAFGNTLPGKLQRMQRAWENVSQSIAVAFLPVMERIADGALRNQTKLQAFANGVAKAVNGMVTFVGAIIRGDWKKAWDTAADGAGKALRAIGVLAEKVLLPLAKKAGEAIVSGLAAGVDSALARIPGGGALRRILGFESATINSEVRVRVIGGQGLEVFGGQNVTGGPPARRDTVTRNPRLRARGGFIDGPSGAGDIVPVLARPNEAFLTERQQALTERIAGVPGLIRRVFAMTGAANGGSRFARGGVVSPLTSAQRFAEAQVGKGYTPGGTGNGPRMGPTYWDCSGYATSVAALIPGFKGRRGGTTFSEYGSSSPASGREPVVYGFRTMGRSRWGNGYQHMGIRVNGVWYDAGSGGVEKGDSRWDVLRVPAGLAGLRAADIEAAETAEAQRTGRSGVTTGVTTPTGRVGGSGPIFPGFGRRGSRPIVPAADRGRAGFNRSGPAPTVGTVRGAPADLPKGWDPMVASMMAPGAADTTITDAARADQLATENANLRRFGGASEDFIRAAFGSGDIRAGGPNAATASGTQVFIQSLIPDGPDVLRRIADAVGNAMGSAAYIPATSVPSGA